MPAKARGPRRIGRMSAARMPRRRCPSPSGWPVADSHTHLDMQDGTVEAGPAQGRGSVGVTTVVQVGCDVKGSRWAAETADAYDAVHAAVALHPNEAPRIVHGDPDGWSRPGRARAAAASGALDEALAEIDRLAALPQVKAVGETGLDYFRTGPEGMAAQERLLPGPHRDRQAAGQGARHPRPRGARGRAAHSARGRRPRADGLPLLFRRRGNGSTVRRKPDTSCPSRETSPSKTRNRCGTRSQSRRWNSFSWRRTRRSSRRRPTADGPMRRISFRSRCAPWRPSGYR